MNFSKTLTAAVAATTIVGAVGLAYAQTTTDPVPSTSTPSTTQQPSMAPTPLPSDSSSTVTPSNSSTPGSSTNSTTTPATVEPALTTSDMATEPMPKADRN